MAGKPSRRKPIQKDADARRERVCYTRILSGEKLLGAFRREENKQNFYSLTVRVFLHNVGEPRLLKSISINCDVRINLNGCDLSAIYRKDSRNYMSVLSVALTVYKCS